MAVGMAHAYKLHTRRQRQAKESKVGLDYRTSSETSRESSETQSGNTKGKQNTELQRSLSIEVASFQYLTPQLRGKLEVSVSLHICQSPLGRDHHIVPKKAR